MRRPATVRFPPWRAAFREVFRLAGDDWTPPRHIKTTLSGGRDRLTFQARFEQPDGTPVRLTVKLSKDAKGEWYATEQKLDVRLTFQPKGAAR